MNGLIKKAWRILSPEIVNYGTAKLLPHVS